MVISNVACGRVVVARPGSVVFPGFSGFLHHVGPHNANIRAFKNAYISSMSFGHVRMYATPYPISLIIFILDLGPSYTDKLLEFRWVQIAHLS